MKSKTTISVESETKELVAAAKEYRGQTYDELLQDVFSGVPQEVLDEMTETEEARS